MVVTMGDKTCSCKGIRKCIFCEKNSDNFDRNIYNKNDKVFVYCDDCKQAFLPHSEHPHNNFTDALEFPGIEIIYDFVTENEEQELQKEIDVIQWVDSQSGRRKQDFGPKVNFKKKKLKLASFCGFPQFSRFIVDRFKSYQSLSTFIPVELCHLEYVPDRGSAIDPHFDDFWLWGERLVTLNLLSGTAWTMTNDDLPAVEVTVNIPSRSLIIASGPARYQWKHSIKREHIQSRRLAMTFRELTPEFLPGGSSDSIGRTLLDTSANYVDNYT